MINLDGLTMYVSRPAGLSLCQHEGNSGIHGGSSICEVQRLPNGRTRIIEYFAWSTREGSGVNVFDEVNDAEL